MMNFTTVPSKRLAASITAASSAIQLNNILGWDGSALTASDFGTRLFAVLRNDANTLMEIVELDPSTIASASITMLKRGLKFTGDLTTEVTANKLSWVKNETIVELGSDVPQLLNHMVQIISDQTIAGIKTFSSVPKTSAGNPVADEDLARKAYVDSVVAGTFPANRIVVAGNAGETVAAGQLVYFDTTDDEWKLCDADTAGTVENVILGIAEGAGTDGNVITSGVLLQGLDTNQSGMTIGDIQYAGNTAGQITNSPGTTVVQVGIAKAATELYFVPRFALALTKNQQDAMAGNLGTPSSSNKFITQSGLQKNAERYAADAGSTDAYAITLSPVPAAYYTGMIVSFKANTANTGAATLDVNSLGPKDITKNYNAALTTGDILANQIVTVVYDGVQFQIVNRITTISPWPQYLLPHNDFTAATSSTALTANSVYITQFYLPFQITIVKIGFWFVANNAASRWASVGIYNQAGTTLLVDSGPKDISVAPPVLLSTTLGSPVTLPVGFYLHASTSSNTNPTFTTQTHDAGFLNLLTLGTTKVKVGTGANASVNGQLPATVGAVSAGNIASALTIITID